MNAIKNAAISAKIVAAMNSGLGLVEAFDSVLGEGAYMKLAGEVYDALRARGGL
jgi:hypothetical protein